VFLSNNQNAVLNIAGSRTETTMRKPLFVLLVLMAFASALLLAQTTSNSPAPNTPAARAQHHVSFLTTVLSLTAAQQQQATTILTNAAEDAVHNNMKAAHQTLHDSIKANDSAAIDQASATIGNLTGQITAINTKAHAALYQVLTPDQQTKLAQLEANGPHGMHGGPMGGGHMVGPPART
jgi:Spy/CpxP family protein refolding chaperone